MKQLKSMALMLVCCLVSGPSAQAGIFSEMMESLTRIGLRKAATETAEAAIKKSISGAAKRGITSTSTSTVLRHADDFAKPAFAKLAAGKVDDVARAGLSRLSPQQSRRLQMLSPELEASGKGKEVLELIGNSADGDKIIDYLWEHRGKIATGTLLATFLAYPDETMATVARGASFVGEQIVIPVATGAIEHAVVPLAVRFPWVVIGMIGLAVGTITLLKRSWVARTLLRFGLKVGFRQLSKPGTHK